MPSLRYLPYFFCACFLLMSGPRAEENTIAVEYQGRQIQIGARFNKPSGPGPFPAVIVLHTCDGIDSQSSTIGLWAALMQAQGYATLRPDSFTARGYAAVCSNTGAVSMQDRAQDVFASAYWLAGRPEIRADRIAVLGLSHGGGAAVYIARDHEELRPLRQQLAARHGKIVASVDLYGGCGSSAGHPVITPLLALLGGRDDWAPPAPCAALASAQANGIMQIQVYPGAYHAFDGPRDRPVSYAGHMVGYDPAAAQDARSRVPQFMASYMR